MQSECVNCGHGHYCNIKVSKDIEKQVGQLHRQVVFDESLGPFVWLMVMYRREAWTLQKERVRSLFTVQVFWNKCSRKLLRIL